MANRLTNTTVAQDDNCRHWRLREFHAVQQGATCWI